MAPQASCPWTFEEAVNQFCLRQAELRSRLAQAGGRDGDPREGSKTDGGAHQTRS